MRCACGVALEGRLGKAYNEEAFRHLLSVERQRAARARQPHLLLLVSLKKQPGRRSRFSPAVAARVFSALWLCLREVDLVGWYREGRIAGASLTLDPRSPSAGVARSLAERVGEVIRERVPASVAGRLHVRVVDVRPVHRG